MDKVKWKGMLHLAAGLTVLYHGFDSFEQANFWAATTYFGFALLYMLVAALHSFIMKRIEYGNTAFFLLEGITILYSAWHYKNVGHTILYIVLALIGVFYFILSVTSIKDSDKPSSGRKRRRKKRRTSSSSSI